MLPLTNAELVEIETPGPLSDSGDPGTPVTAWEGRAAGYLKRVRRSVVSGGQQLTVKQDVFVILRSALTGAGAPLIDKAGPDWTAATVVIDDRRGPNAVRRRFTVQGIEDRAAGTLVDSVRLELDAETAAT